MFHVYYEYRYKRVTLCVALQIMADVITVDNAITLEARKVGFVDVTENQRYVVKQFLKGSDLFVSLPTGSGKSLCYWLLPGLCDTFRGRSGFLVLVISPLVALMKNRLVAKERN